MSRIIHTVSATTGTASTREADAQETAAWEAQQAGNWAQFRYLRELAFAHWNQHVPGMAFSGYQPALDNQAAIQAAYAEAIALTDDTSDEAAAPAAIARLRELDTWLAETLNRPAALT